MPISLRLTTTVGLAALLTACGGAPPMPQPAASPAAGAAAPASPAPAAAVDAAKADMPPPLSASWEARGRRDPFEPLVVREGAAGTSVSSARLTGIVRGRGPVLALVETSDGLGYILKLGDTLGDGRLLEIGQNTVVFSIVPRPGTTNNRVVLRLAGE